MQRFLIGVALAALAGCGGATGGRGGAKGADANSAAGADGQVGDWNTGGEVPSQELVAAYYAAKAPTSGEPYLLCDDTDWPIGTHYAANAEREDCGTVTGFDDVCFVWPDRCRPGMCCAAGERDGLFCDGPICAHDTDCPPLWHCEAP